MSAAALLKMSDARRLVIRTDETSGFSFNAMVPLAANVHWITGSRKRAAKFLRELAELIEEGS